MSHDQAAFGLDQEGNGRKYCYKIIVKGWSYVKKILKPSPRYRRNWISTFGVWIVSILLEPFIFYVPSIQDEEKLFKINNVLLVLNFVLHCCSFIHRIHISHGENKKSEWLRLFRNVETIAALVSNVPIYFLVFFTKVEIRASTLSVVLGIFLVVCLVRLIGIYRFFTEEVMRISSKLAEAALVKIVLNLLLFLYGGHLFGGLWYFFAVWKTMACWKRACSTHSGCRYVDRRFNFSSGDNKFLNDNCTEDTKTYEFGIFKDARKYHIVDERTRFWKKVLYCFRWGIQNISGFGQNLQVSTVEWENIFVILIAIYGVGTFTFFIGNMQNLIKSAIDKRTEEKRKKEQEAIKLRQQQLQQWVLFGKLSENLQNIIKECQQYSCQQTGVVDVENLFINLPKDVENNIKRELCLEPIKKVERFRRFSDTSLLHLCDCVKPVVYAERTRIVREGDPINEMLFVLHGKLWNFSSSASSTNNVPPLDRRKEFLKDGDFWGEELVNWVQDESSSSSSNKLISQTTIQALTKVEAFVLRVDVLKNLYNEKAKILQSFFLNSRTLIIEPRRPENKQATRLQSWLRKRRIRISERNSQEKTPPPPGYQLTGLEIV